MVLRQKIHRTSSVVDLFHLHFNKKKIIRMPQKMYNTKIERYIYKIFYTKYLKVNYFYHGSAQCPEFPYAHFEFSPSLCCHLYNQRIFRAIPCLCQEMSCPI